MALIRFSFACLVMLVAMAGQARAGVMDVRLDISTFVNTTGGNWNNIANMNGLTSDLIDFNTGANTGIGITLSGWRDFFGDDEGSFPDQDWLIQPATRDGAGVSSGSSGTMTLSGLSASSYQIEIVSARTEFDYLNTITIGGALANRTYLGTPVNTPWGSNTDGLAPGNWLIWDNVTSNDILLVSDSNTLGMINAIRILETGNAGTVPEPGSLAIFGIGALGMVGLGVRRKRKQQA